MNIRVHVFVLLYFILLIFGWAGSLLLWGSSLVVVLGLLTAVASVCCRARLYGT